MEPTTIIIILAAIIVIVGVGILIAARRPLEEEDTLPRPSYQIKFPFVATVTVKDVEKKTKWWCSVLFTWKKDLNGRQQPIVVVEGRSPNVPQSFSRTEVNEHTRRVLMQLQPEVLTLATLWENGHHVLPPNIDGTPLERVGA